MHRTACAGGIGGIKSVGFCGKMNMLGKQLPSEVSMDWSTEMSHESML